MKNIVFPLQVEMLPSLASLPEGLQQALTMQEEQVRIGNNMMPIGISKSHHDEVAGHDWDWNITVDTIAMDWFSRCRKPM